MDVIVALSSLGSSAEIRRQIISSRLPFAAIETTTPQRVTLHALTAVPSPASPHPPHLAARIGSQVETMIDFSKMTITE